MLRWIFLALLSPVLSCEQSQYLKDKSFNDLLLFENFILGPASDKSKDECAKECFRNPSCTVFSIFFGTNDCQLYGDVVYPDINTATTLHGRRYYVFPDETCPFGDNFMILRQSNQCIQIFKTAMNYTDVVAECEKFEARPIVLEDEDKTNATTDLLQRNGDSGIYFFLGARVQNTHPDFVWVDGQTLTRDWWANGEPNDMGSGEDCLMMHQNKILDIACSEKYYFLCEISY